MRTVKILAWATLAALPLLAGCVSSDGNVTRSVVANADASRLTMSLTEQMRTEVPNIVYFGFNKDALDATAQARLSRQAEWIMDHPATRFSVIGHADKVGTDQYNTDLAQRRAERAVAFLISKGVSHKQLIAMISAGETSPAVNTNGRERLNRRTVTEVVGFLSKPVIYKVEGDRRVAVEPADAVNSEKNLTSRKNLLALNVSVNLLDLLGIEVDATVRHRLEIALAANLSKKTPTKSGTILDANVKGVVGDVVEVTADVGASVGSTVGDTVDAVGDTVGDVVDAVGDTVDSLL